MRTGAPAGAAPAASQATTTAAPATAAAAPAPAAPVSYEKLEENLKAMGLPQAAIDAAATAKAEKLLADRLSQGAQKQLPVTLGGVPPAKGNEPEPDIGSMNADDFKKLSPAQLKAMESRM